MDRGASVFLANLRIPLKTGDMIGGRKSGWFLFVVVLGMGGTMGCAPEPRKPETAQATKGIVVTNTYPGRGVLKAVDAAQRKITVTHDAIPGYMPRMTMEFNVRDASPLQGLAAGDSVTFRLHATEDDGWVEDLRKTAGATTSAVATPVAPSRTPTNNAVPPPGPRPPASEPLFPGDPLPDFALTNEFVKPVLFSQYRGQAVAFTFFFATCPFPTMCPKMSTNLRDAYRALKSQSDVPTNWHFFSITIDPSTDTPQVLKEYAGRYQYDPVHWSFLTGPEREIEVLGGHFGLQFFREAGALNHNLRTVVINPDGKVRRILIGNEWTPEELVGETRKALGLPEVRTPTP